LHDGVVVSLSWPELRGEFRNGEVVTVGSARRIVDLIEESFQAGLIAQRQNYVQAHELICGKPSDGLRLIVADRIPHLVR
jgi:hypothetical protein